jgi:predicted lipid-binding transport protein (Tim44 family)
MEFIKKVLPIILVVCAVVSGGMHVDSAEARSSSGGKSFKMSPSYKAPSSNSNYRSTPYRDNSGFGKGMMGGLLGGALGGLLFGSMFGHAGSGMGILPLLIIAGIAYFLFKRSGGFGSRRSDNPGMFRQSSDSGPAPFNTDFLRGSSFSAPPPPPPPSSLGSLQEGLEQIRMTDRSFDDKHFLEVASDVFFQVQAGWMRRDLGSYRHLLGDQLANEYEQHFAEMRQNGHINKLESIAIRTIEIVAAGSDGREDFVTVLFAANLLDYTVNDKNGELVSGSMTEPVKFREEWTWARPVRSENWRLEGIKVVE